MTSFRSPFNGQLTSTFVIHRTIRKLNYCAKLSHHLHHISTVRSFYKFKNLQRKKPSNTRYKRCPEIFIRSRTTRKQWKRRTKSFRPGVCPAKSLSWCRDRGGKGSQRNHRNLSELRLSFVNLTCKSSLLKILWDWQQVPSYHGYLPLFSS